MAQEGISVHHGGEAWQQVVAMETGIGSGKLTSSKATTKQREQPGNGTNLPTLKSCR